MTSLLQDQHTFTLPHATLSPNPTRERKLEQIHAMVEEMYAYTDQFCAEESVEGNAERNADLRPAETPVTNEEKESCGETSVSTELRADQSPAAGPGRKSALRSALRSV